MLPSEEPKTFQKNAESLLHVAARVFPVHTGQYATDLKKDSLIEPLIGHCWIYESDVVLKAKTEKAELHHRKVAVHTAKTAKDNAEKDMNLFAIDELCPTQKDLEEAEENEKRFKTAMKMKEQAFTEEWEEVERRLEEHKNNGMAEVRNRFLTMLETTFMTKQWEMEN